MNKTIFKNWYKRPKTTQERRLSYACDKNYIRSARRDGSLPNAWNDIPISFKLNKRSWKKRKKEKQWML